MVTFGGARLTRQSFPAWLLLLLFRGFTSLFAHGATRLAPTINAGGHIAMVKIMAKNPETEGWVKPLGRSISPTAAIFGITTSSPLPFLNSGGGCANERYGRADTFSFRFRISPALTAPWLGTRMRAEI